MEAITPVYLLAINFSSIWTMFVGALAIIVAFGLAVFIHELGHFLAAKAFKVPVERFVIGFDKEAIPVLPRCIWEKKIGETVYGLALVPLGGYVKMSGVVHPEIEKYLEGEPEKKQDAPVSSVEVRADGEPRRPEKNTLQGQAMQDMDALYKKPFWQKVIIYGAGVTMNMILAMIVMAFMYAKGFEEDAPLPAKIGWIAPGNEFANGRVSTGDQFIKVEGTSINSNEALMKVLYDVIGDSDNRKAPENVTFTLQKQNGGEYPLAVATEDLRSKEDFWALFWRPAYVEGIVINDPADKAGIRYGDTIRRIDGVEVEDWSHFRYIVRQAAEQPLDVEVDRAGKLLSFTVTPTENPDEPGIGLVGIVPGNPEKQLMQEPVGRAIASAPGRVYSFTIGYLDRLKALGGKLTSGNIGAVQRELGGPVGIAQIAYRQAERGFDHWLRFLIILNVALAVMNILPIPVLDGGHIVFAAYEAVFRRPVPPKILVPVLNSAVVVILIFFLLVTFNDIFKIFI